MADSVYTFSPTAASNTALDGIAYDNNQLTHGNIDNLFRATHAKIAQLVDDIGGVATTAGTANAQTVTLASGFTAYAAGQIFRVKIGSGLTNTSSTVTMAVNSIAGAKTVKVNYGGVLAAPIPGDIQAGSYCTFMYDGTYIVLLDAQQQGRYPPNFLDRLTLSNNGSDATNDIDIAVGSCRDGADSANIDLLSALTKRLDASWAVGTNQGMLDGTESVAGTPDTSTWYHIWLIKRPDTGVVDVLASESATSPTMPTNYTLKRRIGAVYRSSGAAIRSFKQNGDTFRLLVPILDVNSTNPGTSAQTATLSVPTGIQVFADVIPAMQDLTPTGSSNLLVTALDETDTTPAFDARTVFTPATGATSQIASMTDLLVRTNTSAQIRWRIDSSTGDHTIRIMTRGWVDQRDRV